MSVQGGVCFASSNFDELCRPMTTSTTTAKEQDEF